jgi:hypothetical protein
MFGCQSGRNGKTVVPTILHPWSATFLISLQSLSVESPAGESFLAGVKVALDWGGYGMEG